jgi:hypothetical protein
VKPKLYITGRYIDAPTGREKRQFSNASKKALKLGFEPVLPKTGLLRFNSTKDQIVDAIRSMMECDALALLPDFFGSEVARSVRTVAIAKGKKVYYFGPDGLLYENLLVDIE